MEDASRLSKQRLTLVGKSSVAFFLGICLVSSEVFYPYQILSAQHYSFPKSKESDRERWDFVVMSRVLERISPLP